MTNDQLKKIELVAIQLPASRLKYNAEYCEKDHFVTTDVVVVSQTSGQCIMELVLWLHIYVHIVTNLNSQLVVKSLISKQDPRCIQSETADASYFLWP